MGPSQTAIPPFKWYLCAHIIFLDINETSQKLPYISFVLFKCMVSDGTFPRTPKFADVLLIPFGSLKVSEIAYIVSSSKASLEFLWNCVKACAGYSMCCFVFLHFTRYFSLRCSSGTPDTVDDAVDLVLNERNRHTRTSKQSDIAAKEVQCSKSSRSSLRFQRYSKMGRWQGKSTTM